MAIQVSQSSLGVQHTGALKASVSQIALVVHHATVTTVKVSQEAIVVQHTGPLQPVQVSGSWITVQVSLNIQLVAEVDSEDEVPAATMGITLGINVELSELESEPDVDVATPTWDWRIVRPTVLVREFNPHRPTVPEEFRDVSPQVFDFQRESQEILREQHNVTQGGDSTFPWEMMAKVQTIPMFRLGSIGRFYHEDLGILQARYVRFTKMDMTVYPNGPLGSLKTLQKNPWIVTNQLSLSHPDAVVGIAASYDDFIEGGYGWALVNGSPFFDLSVVGDSPRGLATSYSWAANGQVGANAPGRILARRSGDSTIPGLSVGAVRVELEGLSAEDVRQLANVDAVNESIADLWAAINALSGATGEGANYQPQIDALKAQLELTTQQLTGRINALSAQVSAASGLTPEQVNGLIATSLIPIVESQNVQDQDIQALQQSVVNALAAIALLSPLSEIVTQVQAQLVQLSNAFDLYRAKPPVFRPLVTGAIPAEFVQNPDGSIIVAQLRPEEYL